MSVFDPTWHVLVFYEDGDGMSDEYDEYNGIQINDFNGGEPLELVFSAHPTVAVAQGWEELREVGSTTFDSVDLTTFRMLPEPPRFQTGELRIQAESAEGRKVLLVIKPGYEVENRVNGFDMMLGRRFG